MLIVLDTNVLVSSLLKRNSNPGRVLDLTISNQVQVAFDSRTLKEYVNVLARPRLGILPSSTKAVLSYMTNTGLWVKATPLNLNLQIFLIHTICQSPKSQ